MLLTCQPTQTQQLGIYPDSDICGLRCQTPKHTSAPHTCTQIHVTFNSLQVLFGEWTFYFRLIVHGS